MKKMFVVMAALVSLSAAPAFANGPGDRHEGNGPGYENGKGHQQHGNGKGLGHHKHEAVPEIDAAGAALAIALLGGVVSISRERKKK